MEPNAGFYMPNNDQIIDLDTMDRIKVPYKYIERAKFSDILADASERPQIKTHLQFTYGENSNLWLRYTRSGSTFNGITFKQKYQTGFDSVDFYTTSDFINFTVARNEQFIASFDNFYEINKDNSLKIILTFDSENNSRAMDYVQKHPEAYAPPKEIMDQLSDINSLRNQYYAISETEIQTRVILNSEIQSNLSSAFGFEYTYNNWGKSWGKPDGYLRLGDSWNIISDKNSPAYGYRNFFGTDTNDVYFVGNGWHTNTFSVFGELNYEIDDFQFLASGRMDKDDYSNFLFSPRLAVIYSINDKNKLKLIAQQSVRMNTAEEMLIQKMKNIPTKDESIQNLELIYTTTFDKSFYLNLSTYVNSIDILSWNDPLRSTLLVGNLDKFGIEFDLIYKKDNVNIIFNHTYNKQLNWRLLNDNYQSGISYSDYNTPLDGSTLIGVGNDLNNWSNHVTKLIANIGFFENKLNWHINTRVYWNFEGANDGMQMMKNAAGNSTDEENKRELNSIISIIEKYDTYGVDARINSSITYTYEILLLLLFME